MKKILTLVLSCAMLLSLFAGMAFPASAEVTADGIAYTVSGNTAAVTGYTGDETALTVPSTLGGAAVTAIADNAFADNTALAAVALPDTLQTIGECAFYGCTALEALTIGNVNTIGYSAFDGCTSLATVTFGGSKAAWSTVDIAAFNEPLTAAAITFTGTPDEVSLLPDSAAAFSKLSEGGGTISVSKVTSGYSFSSNAGWPSAYTTNSTADYVTVDVFSDTYLNFDFTVMSGQTNIILAFNGMDIADRAVGEYVTLNRLIDPSYVDDGGTIYDLGTGVYTASVHVGALGCDPSLVTNGTFSISDIKIYAVGGTVNVRDLSVGEAKYNILDLAQTSYRTASSQTLLPADVSAFKKGLTNTGSLYIYADGAGYRMSSSGGYPCGYTANFETGENYVLADPDQYLYYDFSVPFGNTHIAVYFGGTDPMTAVAGTHASLNGFIHPNYVDASGTILDLPVSAYKGFIRVGDLGCSPSLMQDGKVPISDIKIFAVNGVVIVNALDIVTIETYDAPVVTTTTASTTTTTTTTTTTAAHTPVTLTVTSTDAAIGSTVTVEVAVSEEHRLVNGQLWLHYDPTVLEPQFADSAEQAYITEIGSDVLGDCFWAFDIPTAGLAKFAFASASTNGSAVGGTVFSLTFKVLDTDADSTAITLSAPELCAASNGEDYIPAVTLVDGTVAVTALLGDVVVDGVIDLLDVQKVFYYVNGKVALDEQQLLAADVTKDGTVNLRDAVALFYTVSGLM